MEVKKNNNNFETNLQNKVEKFEIPSWNFKKKANQNDNSSKKHGYKSELLQNAITSLKAQYKMHVKRNIIPAEEGNKLIENLDSIQKKYKNHNYDGSVYEFLGTQLKEMDEKSYSWSKVARSQNAQEVGDIRLMINKKLSEIDSQIQSLQSNFIEIAEDNIKTIIPSNVSGQLQQPNSLSHYFMSLVEMLGRDRSRFSDFKKRNSLSPYGASEGVGNSFNLNLEMVSRNVGFSSSFHNSLDALASYDNVIEYFSSLTNSSINIARFARDISLWQSSENSKASVDSQFLKDNDCLPYQKISNNLNSAILDLNSINSYLQNIANYAAQQPIEPSAQYEHISKMTYEASSKYIDAVSAINEIAKSLKFNAKSFKDAGSREFSTAQDLRDWIIQNANVNWDEANKRTRQIIEYAISKNKKLSLLDLNEIQKIEPSATNDIYSVLIPSRAIISRRSGNGSNPVQIRKHIRLARRKFL